MRPVCLYCTALAVVLGLSAVKFFSTPQLSRMDKTGYLLG
jgi:hypothetical protein